MISVTAPRITYGHRCSPFPGCDDSVDGWLPAQTNYITHNPPRGHGLSPSAPGVFRI